ncbi:LysR family transcriptional regulator [Microvirga guangxiensis]|uniref:DNA-binding transcriptional regulator, LysR family n=1 Tax=Microvirga guangxiensis TaxID=549386 RepID=A0A1G5G6P9_9HYPH|nr:LysR family transcriptional regulator [Microvirga guangxiensis]SCY47212.1 DNA-binding transcriptional regulator, LysR family [Microvirga guangxiensis]
MRSFRRVIERGSFSRAAEELGLSSAGLGKQIRWLEERLGTVLIQRTTRRMGLTETGRAYYEECCRILDEIDAVEHSIAADAGHVTGRLRVNAPLSFGLTVLSPILPAFMATYPDLTIDLTLSDHLLDVVGSGFDVSIRVRSELADSSLIARRLADVDQIICAAPAYLERRGAPLDLDDLHRHDCLAYTLADNPGVWHLKGPKGDMSIAVPVRLSANNSIMLRDMLLAGMGIGALPSFIAKPQIDSGALVPVLKDHVFPQRHVYAVYPTSRHLQRKVRVFLDFLADTLEARL